MNTLNARGDCVQEIRRLIAEDAWMARFALLSALQLLDLAGVNQVLTDLERRQDDPQWAADGRIRRLLDERFST